MDSFIEIERYDILFESIWAVYAKYVGERGIDGWVAQNGFVEYDFEN